MPQNAKLRSAQRHASHSDAARQPDEAARLIPVKEGRAAAMHTALMKARRAAKKAGTFVL
jgi:hypothetical protein